MTKEYREVDASRLAPGMRVEVRTEGVVTVNEDRLEVRTDDGSTWSFLPSSSKLYQVVELQFCLLGGTVVSQHDGDVHRVPAERLVQLYNLRPGEYQIHNGFATDLCRGLRHLRPRSDGDYGRPTTR